MIVSFKIFSWGMKSKQRLGMWVCTWFASENRVKEPSSWPLAVQASEIGAPGGKENGPENSLVCLANCTQAAKAFTKERTLLFSTLAVAAWCWLQFRYSRHWRRSSLNKSVNILVFRRTRCHFDVNAPFFLQADTAPAQPFLGSPLPSRVRWFGPAFIAGPSLSVLMWFFLWILCH